MITVERLEDIPTFSSPIALTLGTFDGVHLGHQHLLSELKKRATPVVLTFSNHPTEILRPKATPPLIDTPQQKLRHFEKSGVALTILLPFDSTLAALPYDTFLKQIRHHLPFSYLVLGEGSAFGQGREGHAANISRLSQELAFEPIYLPKFTIEGEVVSSKKIRELIEIGNFEHAFRLLGRLKDKE